MSRKSAKVERRKSAKAGSIKRFSKKSWRNRANRTMKTKRRASRPNRAARTEERKQRTLIAAAAEVADTTTGEAMDEMEREIAHRERLNNE